MPRFAQWSIPSRVLSPLSLQLGAVHAAPEAVFEVADVREAVPLARCLRVEVVEHVVAVVADGDLAEDGVAELAAPIERRVGLLLLPVHREDGALLHEAGRGDDAFGRLQVEHADVVVVAEQSPGRFGGVPRDDRQFAVGGQLIGQFGHVDPPANGRLTYTSVRKG